MVKLKGFTEEYQEVNFENLDQQMLVSELKQKILGVLRKRFRFEQAFS